MNKKIESALWDLVVESMQGTFPALYAHRLRPAIDKCLAVIEAEMAVRKDTEPDRESSLRKNVWFCGKCHSKMEIDLFHVRYCPRCEKPKPEPWAELEKWESHLSTHHWQPLSVYDRRVGELVAEGIVVAWPEIERRVRKMMEDKQCKTE